MKALVMFLLLTSSFAFALQVTHAAYNQPADQLEIQIQYQGGCFEHRFELHLVNCALARTENNGLVNICDANVVDITGVEDRCQTPMKRQLVVPLATVGATLRPILAGFESGVVLVPKKSY